MKWTDDSGLTFQHLDCNTNDIISPETICCRLYNLPKGPRTQNRTCHKTKNTFKNECGNKIDTVLRKTYIYFKNKIKFETQSQLVPWKLPLVVVW